MVSRKHILITGGSIAGPCLAFWLVRAGHQVTLVEKAPRLRDGGQNIDIKGSAQAVVERMGLLPAIKARDTREKGLMFVNAANQTKASFPRRASTSFTAEIEILRGELAAVFYEATRNQVDYRFGISVAALEEKPDGMHVTFTDKTSALFDLVICAEGIGSPTRQQVFNDGSVSLQFLRTYTAYFRIPREQGDDDWARWYTAPGKRLIFVRPGTDDTITVSLNFASDQLLPDLKDVTTQKAFLREKFQDLGWMAPRILAHLDYEHDFYFGPLSQVKARTWSKGRFAMTGDAAYCPSPLTGMGTSLAIVGAYVLAGELATQDDHHAAFANYEARLRDYVEAMQTLPPGVPGLAYPKTAWGVTALNVAAGVIASPPVQATIGFFARRKPSAGKDGFTLPDYTAFA